MKKPQRILYAEDNLYDIELTLAALRKSNLTERVDIVNNGIEAIDYLFYRGKFSKREKSIPDLLLLDIQMPGMDGIKVLKVIRESEEHRNLPVVILTSSSMESDIKSCYSVGANAYVVKPIDYNDYVSAIKGIEYFWGELNTPNRQER
jgi:CheY-like chemotaxis protein